MSDRFQERLSLYLDRELPAEEARELEAHLAGCASCRGTLADLRRIVETARTLPDRPPERELWPGIEARLRRPWRISPLVAAAVVVALGTAWWIWPTGRPPAEPKLARYLMLLHEPPGHGAGATGEEIAAVVDEYRTWAQGVARSGRLISGEKLADGWGWILRPEEADLPGAGRGASDVGGYFVIAAASDREARELARTCPHLAHDGWIELRPIEDTDVPRPRSQR